MTNRRHGMTATACAALMKAGTAFAQNPNPADPRMPRPNYTDVPRGFPFQTVLIAVAVIAVVAAAGWYFYQKSQSAS